MQNSLLVFSTLYVQNAFSEFITSKYVICTELGNH